jgi:phage terminase large subunit-like protein
MIYSRSIPVALAPERAIHLFTPVGERAWVAHWDPAFPAGEHGDGSAPGTVFLTGDTHWVVVDRAPDRVRYARITPGVRAGTVEVRVRADGDGAIADVTYDMTPIAAGDEFDPAIHEWENAIAPHLRGLRA